MSDVLVGAVLVVVITDATPARTTPEISNSAFKLGQIGPKWDKSGTF